MSFEKYVLKEERKIDVWASMQDELEDLCSSIVDVACTLKFELHKKPLLPFSSKRNQRDVGARLSKCILQANL